MNDLLTLCSKFEKINDGNGKGDTSTREGVTVNSNPLTDIYE